MEWKNRLRPLRLFHNHHLPFRTTQRAALWAKKHHAMNCIREDFLLFKAALHRKRYAAVRFFPRSEFERALKSFFFASRCLQCSWTESCSIFLRWAATFFFFSSTCRILLSRCMVWRAFINAAICKQRKKQFSAGRVWTAAFNSARDLHTQRHYCGNLFARYARQDTA